MSGTNGHQPGFRIPEKTARLVFEGDMAGAEVVVRLQPIPLHAYLELQSKAGTDIWGAIADFVDIGLVSWNIEDGDGPIPPTAEGVLRADPMVGRTVFFEWLKAVVNPPAPLPETSAGTPIPAGRSRRSSRKRSAS